MRSILPLSACAATYFALIPWSAAEAGCYDALGCSDRDLFRAQDLAQAPDCEFLWHMRNEIYKERGYCFHTQRAIVTFGNAGCQYDDEALVPLNAIERTNMRTIRAVEHAKMCPI